MFKPMTARDESEQGKPPPPKPPRKGEGVDDQSEEADDTDLYDRDEDMYNQDADVLENLTEDSTDDSAGDGEETTLKRGA